MALGAIVVDGLVEVVVVTAATEVVVETGAVVVVVGGAVVVVASGPVVVVAGIDVSGVPGGWLPGVAVLVPQAARASVARTMTMRRIAFSFLDDDDSVAT